MRYIIILRKLIFKTTSLLICLILLLTYNSASIVSATLNPNPSNMEEVELWAEDIVFNSEALGPEITIAEISRIDTSFDIVSILNQKSTKTISYPVINNSIIAWSEISDNSIHNSPRFINIGENIIYELETKTLNAEPVKVDRGVLIYRDNNKNLLITNVSDEINYGLGFGETRQINPTGFEVGQFVVADGKVVFANTSINKDIYIFCQGCLQTKHLFKINGSIKNLSISIYNNETILWWGQDNKIYYTNLDRLDQNDDYKLPTEIEMDYLEYFSVYANRIVFINNNDKLYLQDIDSNDEPKYLCETASTDIFLHNNLVFYVDKNNDLAAYNIENGKSDILYECASMPFRIASNGEDVVWTDNKDAYWLAGLKRLEIINLESQLDVGEIVSLYGRAIYNNNFIPTELKGAVWLTSNEKVIHIIDNKLIAMAPGIAEVSLKYKEKKISYQVLVKEISPPTPKSNNKPRNANSANTNHPVVPVLSAQDLSALKNLYFYNRYSYLYFPWYILGENLNQTSFLKNVKKDK